MLISDETVEKINLLIQEMFNLNREWDRAMGVMTVDWAFDNFVKKFHERTCSYFFKVG